jgi:thiol-disulfide isomerase/thioredoxin
MNKKTFITLAMGMLIAILFNVNGVSAQNDGKPYKRLYAKSFLNQKAPEIVVEKWLTEKPDMDGKFVLIDFWATWCGPCKRAIPKMNAWSKKYKDQLVVMGLTDESEKRVSLMKSPVIEYYSAIDPQRRLKNIYQVRGIPHVVLIDPDGIVRWEGFPFLRGYELTDEVFEEIFRKYGKK